MQQERLMGKRESSEQNSEVDYLKYLKEFISDDDLNQLKSCTSDAPKYDLLAKNLHNYYFLECKKPENFPQRVRKAVSTFTVLPSSTVNDYLVHTSLNVSPNKAIANDWKKVGEQLWVTILKQPEVKSK